MTQETFISLNGALLAAHQAALPVADRGFRYGDGVFETIRLQGGVPYQWELHLKRLQAGLRAVRIAMPEIAWADIARALLAKNHIADGFLRIAISRGVGGRGYLPTETTPNVVMETIVIASEAKQSSLKNTSAADAAHWIASSASLPRNDGFVLWVSKLAKIPAICLPTGHKLAQGMNSTLAAIEAAEHGCDEALQCSPEGMVSEAASANLFWVKDGQIFTPHADSACLLGTTRAAIMRLSSTPVIEVLEPLTALEHADAVWISNTRLGVQPVAALEPLGWRYDVSHPLLLTLQTQLNEDREAYTAQHRDAWTHA